MIPVLPQALVAGPPKVPPARRSVAKSPSKQNGRLAQALNGKKRGKKYKPNSGNRKYKKLKAPRRK
jgi:hypothetical protein